MGSALVDARVSVEQENAACEGYVSVGLPDPWEPLASLGDPIRDDRGSLVLELQLRLVLAAGW